MSLFAPPNHTLVDQQTRKTMQIINAYYGTTLLEAIVLALRNNSGERFDVGVGFAKYLSGETFNRFGAAVDDWLKVSNSRTFRVFIGDQRHPADKPDERSSKIRDCTEVAANLIKFSRNLEERMEVVFVPKLHAKFYSMWSCAQSHCQLEWAIIGSSNLTDAALTEKNIELDVYIEPNDSQLGQIQNMLAAVIASAYSDGDSWGVLHDKIDLLTAKSRWESDKERSGEEDEAEIAAEEKAQEQRLAEAQARAESDSELGILRPD